MSALPTIGARTHGRDNHFNLIRILAAAGVLFSHAYPLSLGADAVQPLQPFLHGTTLGTVCVYVFFCVSGFYICKSFDHSTSRKRFLKARALRLFPALAVALVVTVIVAGFWLTTESLSVYLLAAPEYILRNLTLNSLQQELPGVFVANPFGQPTNGSLWTLIYEVQCYFGVFLLGLLGLLKRRYMFMLVAIGLLLTVLMAKYAAYDHHLLSLGLPFLWGSIFYVWRDSIVLDIRLCLIMLVVVFLVYNTSYFHFVFVFALCYWVFFLGLFKSTSLLRYNRLGDYSYGLYIYAFPVQQMVAHTGVTDPLHNIALSLPITLACAILSWHLIEKPSLKHVPSNQRPVPLPAGVR